MAVTAERETPVTVLLERHLIDLQLRNAPEQYLISRVLARLVDLESTSCSYGKVQTERDIVGALYWQAIAETLAQWLIDGRQIRSSMPVAELVDKATAFVREKLSRERLASDGV